MSSENFDKKIREKLVRHIPKYDAGAWDSFKKMLPAPWYVKLFRDYSGWLFGGVATTALLLTTIYQTKKTEELNDKIFTLSEQLQRGSVKTIDTVFVERTITDTVYVTRYEPVMKEKLVYVENPESMDLYRGETRASLAGNQFDYNTPPKGEKQPVENPLDVKETQIIGKKTALRSQENKKSGGTNEPPGGRIKEPEESEVFSTIPSAENDVSTENEHPPVKKESVSIADTDQGTLSEVPEKLLLQATHEDVKIEKQENAPEYPQTEQKIDSEEQDTPSEKPKRKMNWPQMRLGVSSDFLGFKTLVTGPSFEVFFSDKFSFNTGILFSGQQTIKHPRAMDFNSRTGKQFEEEYKKYLPEKPPMISDIEIKTSFVKMPVYLNYYIPTWSRFSVVLSAGTKLDLSVYQNIDFRSGAPGNQMIRRFEARPTPKVLTASFMLQACSTSIKSLWARSPRILIFS